MSIFGSAFILPLLAVNLLSNESPLEPYEWKNRLIVYQTPDEEMEDFAKLLTENSDDIAARDLLFFRLGEDPELPFHGKLSPREQEEVAEQLSIHTRNAEPIFVLIGKDGGEKSRQTGILDLEEWFGLIDTMPMRKREMRETG